MTQHMISTELDLILETILVDSDYYPQYVDVISRIYVDAGRAPSLLPIIMRDLEDRIDYTSDGGERPFPGASSLIREIEHYLRKEEK